MMINWADFYGILATELEDVARVLEKKFDIAFNKEHDSEMGGVYYDNDPDPDSDVDGHWVLYWPDDDEEEEGETFADRRLPIVLSIHNAPDMNEVRRRMLELDEFVVVHESRKVFDNAIRQMIESYDRYESPDEEEVKAV